MAGFKVGDPCDPCCTSTPPCAASPILVCPKFEGCAGSDLSGATFTLISSTGAVLGTTTSDSSGVGTPCISVTTPFTGAHMTLTGVPCIYNAPANITGLTAAACGTRLGPDFGTLTVKSTSSCCCPGRCTPYPGTVTITINGKTLTATLTPGLNYHGCITLPVAATVTYGPSSGGCLPTVVPGGSTTFFVGTIAPPPCTDVKITWFQDSATGFAVDASQIACSPTSFEFSGDPLCGGFDEMSYDSGILGTVDDNPTVSGTSCDPIFGTAVNNTRFSCPPPFPACGPDGDVLYQAFGGEAGTFTIAE